MNNVSEALTISPYLAESLIIGGNYMQLALYAELSYDLAIEAEKSQKI